jgi:hypothetical protein
MMSWEPGTSGARAPLPPASAVLRCTPACFFCPFVPLGSRVPHQSTTLDGHGTFYSCEAKDSLPLSLPSPSSTHCVQSSDRAAPSDVGSASLRSRRDFSTEAWFFPSSLFPTNPERGRGWAPTSGIHHYHHHHHHHHHHHDARTVNQGMLCDAHRRRLQ